MKQASSFLLFLTLITLFTLSAFGQDFREVRKSSAFEPNGRLTIDTYKGSIRVLAWDKAEIEIFARIESDGSDRYSREQVEDTEIRIDLSSHSAHIKTDYGRVNSRHRGFWGMFGGDNSNILPLVQYTIKVPRTTALHIKDYKSRIEVNDMQSDVDIDTYKGEIEVTRLMGSLALNTYKGEGRIDFAGLSGRSHLETYKGNIEISLPRARGFELDADIGRHGNLESDFAVEQRRPRSRHSDMEVRSSVNGGGPLLQLKTDHGTMRLIER